MEISVSTVNRAPGSEDTADGASGIAWSVDPLTGWEF